MEPIKEEKVLPRKSRIFKTPNHFGEAAPEEKKPKTPKTPKTPGSSDNQQSSQGAKHRIAAIKRFLPKPVSAQKGPPEEPDSEDEAISVHAKARPPDPPDDPQRTAKLLKDLEKERLFEGCSIEFLEVVLRESKRRHIAPGEALRLGDGGSLFLIETGALRFEVGDDQMSIQGAGSLVNGAGFLRLINEARIYKQRNPTGAPARPRPARSQGYDVHGYSGPPPAIYMDFRGPPKQPEDYDGPDDVTMAFYNTCPYACRSSQSSSNGWMSLAVTGALPGEQPGKAGAALPKGGATVLALPSLQKIQDMLDRRSNTGVELNIKSLGNFGINCEEIHGNWTEIMEKFQLTVFPGAPSEAMYALASVARSTLVPKGSFVVSEGETGEDADALVLLVSGVASVLKKVRVEDHVLEQQTVGRLRGGAIIGDISLIGASMPRPATVRAKTDVEAIVFPGRSVLAVLAAFPTLLNPATDRLVDTAECIKERLLTKTEVASSLNLFYGCDLGFVNDVASNGERRLLFAGETVVQQGSTVGTLFVLEHGRVSIQISGVGTVNEVPAGNCFGERTLLGIAAEANATVRVATPFALALAILRTALHKALKKHPVEVEHFEKLKTSPQGGRISGSKVRHVELFRASGTGFLEALNSKVTSAMFLHGQTIVVEGSYEEDPAMFVLSGGIVVAERHGHAIARISPGATFGELQFIEAGASHDNSQDEAEDEEDLVQELYIFLQGDATLTCPLTGERAWQCGEVMGESPFAGTTRLYPARVTANTVCLVQVYKKNEIFEAMAKQEGRDRELLQRLVNEAQPFGLSQMRKRLQRSFSFRNAHAAFSSALVRLPDVVLFPPNRLITEQGDECKLGESQFFLVLVGRVKVAGAVGTLFSMVGAGQVFGEVGAFGISKRRTASACTWQEGYVSCLRFTGAVVRAAVNEFPLDREKLAQIWKRTEVMNRSTELERREWIKTTAIPALAQTPLLGGCPPSFFHSLSVLLQEQLYKSNSEIVKCGDKLEHMILLVAGAAQMRTRVGDDIGMMRKGSMFGEINALGLFNYSMATIQSTERTRLLVLPHAAMKQALASPAAKQEGICVAFQKLVDGRYDQVDRGVPLCGMGITTQKDDPRVRAIALLAERRDLEAGDEWCPVPDSEPAGPFFGVLVSGRVMVEIGPEHHIVLQLTSGAIFPEGLLASYGAICRAETTCEAYRVRWHDFYMAVGLSTPSATDWFWKFRVQEKATVERLTRRLQSVQGLLHVNVPHRKDEEIQAWKAQRGERISQAKRMSSTLAVQASDRLPILEASNPTRVVFEKKTVSVQRRQTRFHQCGLLSYTGSALIQLPKLIDERGHSKSESSLPR